MRPAHHFKTFLHCCIGMLMRKKTVRKIKEKVNLNSKLVIVITDSVNLTYSLAGFLQQPEILSVLPFCCIWTSWLMLTLNFLVHKLKSKLTVKHVHLHKFTSLQTWNVQFLRSVLWPCLPLLDINLIWKYCKLHIFLQSVLWLYGFRSLGKLTSIQITLGNNISL